MNVAVPFGISFFYPALFIYHHHLKWNGNQLAHLISLMSRTKWIACVYAYFRLASYFHVSSCWKLKNCQATPKKYITLWIIYESSYLSNPLFYSWDDIFTCCFYIKKGPITELFRGLVFYRWGPYKKTKNGGMVNARRSNTRRPILGNITYCRVSCRCITKVRLISLWILILGVIFLSAYNLWPARVSKSTLKTAFRDGVTPTGRLLSAYYDDLIGPATDLPQSLFERHLLNID